ncbi:response regulator [Psychrosphaera sp. B3R10]|uniref:response regulator n=1 Tax=unclassified Psychrosphaera TaxID=2641570 RepID=UPI001C084441|nr:MULTISPECIES: response regulator [unclassified Psychrosphaera]MBU2881166.1 response regulator [Psychrosphaera sp. I2R16]MBU2988271.1 response regulator [Psychrosphaera sp. B3R10]MDO6718480.1 response regulator [Psychrosphaera sp. 1_MG-2023]
MQTTVIICDDSNLARKQMARSLPDEWDVEVVFAVNGEDALDIIRKGQGDLLFLDLNMPVLDGYGVLEALQAESISIITIVVSGDIQTAAHERVKALGALDFIKKPIDKEKLQALLHKYGITSEAELGKIKPKAEKLLDAETRDVLQEVTNVAMGQAGSLLATVLDVFVKLPIPNVNLLEVSELAMALQSVETNDTTSGVCQGFISGGVAGEALLILHDSGFKDIAKLLNYKGKVDSRVELELLMDIGNILIGSVLKGLSEQLDLNFSQGHPTVLGQHCNVSDLIYTNSTHWKKTLTIEISYGLEGHDVTCDLLLLITEDSIPTLQNKLNFLFDI